eukprot:jgi/Chrzof1/12450/Cz06g34320.t1
MLLDEILPNFATSDFDFLAALPISSCNVLPQNSTLQALTGLQDGVRPPLQYGRRSTVAAVRAAPPPQYGRRRVSASRQRFLDDAGRPLPGDGSSGTSPVRRQSVRTTFGLDATVGGYVGAMSDSSARALRHLAKRLLQSATHTTERPRGAATESRVDGRGTDGRGEGLHPGGEWGEATKICWENFQARWGMPSSSHITETLQRNQTTIKL